MLLGWLIVKDMGSFFCFSALLTAVCWFLSLGLSHGCKIAAAVSGHHMYSSSPLSAGHMVQDP